jgi:hypothetical protein
VQPAKELLKSGICQDAFDRVEGVAQFVVTPGFVDKVLTGMARGDDFGPTFATRDDVVAARGHVPFAKYALLGHKGRVHEATTMRSISSRKGQAGSKGRRIVAQGARLGVLWGMGAHYSSMQVRTDNRDAVVAAVEDLARERKRRVLLGPRINGWVGLYLDDDSGGDEAFAAAVAKRLGVTVLHLMVHDSDIFFYNFFRGGQLLDEYSSYPDYFEEVSAEERDRLRGKPEVFRDLAGSDAIVAQIRALLTSDDKEKFLFEEHRLEKLAELLGIENGLTSYRYLTLGEWDAIKERKLFIHIPDLSAERAAKRTAERALRAEKKRLQKEGPFCLECRPPGNQRQRVNSRGDFCFDPVDGGLLVRWYTFGGPARPPVVLRYQSPWTAKPEPVEPPPTSLGCVTNAARNLIAFADGGLRVWDQREERLVAHIATDAVPVAFSQDDRFLLCQSPLPLVLVSLEEKKIARLLPFQGQYRAVHPSFKFLVTQPRQDQIGIVDLERGEVIKVLFTGQTTDWSALATPFAEVFKAAGVGAPELEEWKRAFVHGHYEILSLKFSPDGALMFCGTTSGLVVWEWEEVLTSQKTTPAPLFSMVPVPEASETQDRQYENYLYDVVLDDVQNRLLFGGIEGKVRFLNLEDRSTGVLLDPPGKVSVVKLQLSHDRRYLGCLCGPPSQEADQQDWRVQVWDYQELARAVGLR